MLRRGQPLTTGEARFFDQIPGSPEPNAKVFVRFRLGEQVDEVTGLLDTGATYSIFRSDLADYAGLPTESSGTATVSTRLGSFKGRLVRSAITLVADQGEELRTEATFLIVDDWPGGNFLGYTGFLERIRFALDPPANRFYFGSGDDEA